MDNGGGGGWGLEIKKADIKGQGLEPTHTNAKLVMIFIMMAMTFKKFSNTVNILGYMEQLC